MVIDVKLLEISKQKIAQALSAEGIEGVGTGYTNLHLLPIFQEKIAFGSKGFPWNSEFCKRDIDYSKGICPVAESLHDDSHISIGVCQYELENSDVDLIVKVFKKVWSNLELLR